MPNNASSVQDAEFEPKPKAVFVAPHIHLRLKEHCNQHPITMQMAGEQAITEWLNRQARDLHTLTNKRNRQAGPDHAPK